MGEKYILQVVSNTMKSVATTLLCSILLVLMSFSPAMVFEPSDDEKLGKKDVSSTSQAQQPDNDGDGTDDFNDPDDDNDGYEDSLERDCGSDPLNPMSTPTYSDKDDLCDGIDLDDDNDGYSDLEEIDCNSDPLDNDDFPLDSDGDGYCDALDDFPNDPNEWSDFDGDGIGDNADPDDDNDGVLDSEDAFPFDRCVAADWDGDGLPDYVLSQDCIFRYGGEIDPDDDNDGVLDYADDLPLDPCGSVDTDGDGTPDFIHIDKNCDQSLADNDDDNDGYPDKGDAFPTDPSEWLDTDGDGIGNNADQNDDGDGWSDLFELLCETDPFDITDYPLDTDGDGHCDFLDTDDDNDGILDVNDPEPLDTEGSWEWATGAGNMIKINDMVMDSSSDILVTGSYKGNTILGGIALTQHNKEDVFVAKMNNQGDWLWAATSEAEPKWCANDRGPEYTYTQTSSSSTGFITTGVYIAESSWWLGSDTIVTNTSQADPNLHFSLGDMVYNNATNPPEFLGNVSYTTSSTIQLQENYTGGFYSLAGVELVKLDLDEITIEVSTPLTVGQGQWDKHVWDESFAVANSIDIDDDGNAYITGNFFGYVNFDNDKLKSYAVRNEGDWLREDWIRETGTDSKITGYPCGPDYTYIGNGGPDMFIAKIDTSGEWDWAKSAGTQSYDTGDNIVVSTEGNHAFISGLLRQPNNITFNFRNDGCTPLQHFTYKNNGDLKGVHNHKGMFNGIIGTPHLEGCGAYIAKISLNGNWKDAWEISPPSQSLERYGDIFSGYQYVHEWPSCSAYSCSDRHIEITGMVAMGSPERLYITGNYAGHLDMGSNHISSGSYTEETWFIAKFAPSTGSWVWVQNGPTTYFDSEIHDIVDNGVWDLYVSGCKDGGKFVGLFNGDGTWSWTDTFDTSCEPTEISLGQTGPYVIGTYIQNNIDFGGTILENSAPIALGHFVAHWDVAGNFVWAEDNLHILQNQGSSSAILINDDARPTGILVDGNDRVYTCGYIKGGGFFKSDTLFGDTSYVAAIDGPLIVVEPSIIIDHDNDSGASIPNLSLLSTLIMMLFAALYSRRNN